MTRASLGRLVLWALVLCYSFFLAGHLYEIIVLVPNWSSGIPDDVGRYRDFLSHSGPGRYFMIVGLPAFITSILAIAATWSAGKRLRLLSIVPLLIFIVYGVWTQWYFVPINHYVGGEHYDAVILKAKVDGWVFWEIPRTVLVGLGLVVAICHLELYGRRASKSPQS